LPPTSQFSKGKFAVPTGRQPVRQRPLWIRPRPYPHRFPRSSNSCRNVPR